MNRDPVHLNEAQRERAVHEIARSFAKWRIDLRIVGIDAIHLHVLARIPDHNPRHWLGLAKKESSAYMKRDGLAPQGGLWAVRCECKPIADGAHFENTVRYIGDHALRGAVVRSIESPGC